MAKLVRQSNDEGNKKFLSETATFRIDQGILNPLRKESKQNMESLNVVINKILKSYVNYHVPLRRARYIHFSTGPHH